MPKPRFVSFQEIKHKVSMEEILEHYGLLPTLRKRGGDALTGPCPIHKGTNPTQFRVSLSKNCWNCFGGCKGGNVLDFVAQMEGKNIREAALLIQGWFSDHFSAQAPNKTSALKEVVYRTSDIGSTEPKVTEGPPAALEALSPDPTPHIRVNPPLHFPGLKHLDHGHEFLRKQGFQLETMERFGVGYCGKGMMKGCIAIPIHNAKGELLAYAGRAVDEEMEKKEGKYKYPPNFVQGIDLYNFHRAVQSERLREEGVILVPDFFDVFRLCEAGFDNVAALMGEELSAEQFTLLLETLGAGERITLLFREDFRGGIAILSQLIRDFFVRLVRLEKSPGAMSREEIQQALGTKIVAKKGRNNSNSSL